jgi:hypothetical protein
MALRFGKSLARTGHRGHAYRVSGRPVDYAIEKWGGHPHYRGVMYHLGDHEHGSWLWGPAGRTISRGDAPAFVTEVDAVALISPDAWWTLTWWLEHSEVMLYVNIDTPAVWDDDRVVVVDLDLDVIRFNDGRVEVVDEDEFALHQQQFGYPPELVAAAEAATATALDLASRNEPPFDGDAASRWAARARAMTLG